MPRGSSAADTPGTWQTRAARRVVRLRPIFFATGAEGSSLVRDDEKLNAIAEKAKITCGPGRMGT
jgi:hypothetical protein